jgi:ferredoxin-NADP reductase
MPTLDQWDSATLSRTTLIAPDVRLIELTPAIGAQPYEPGSHLKIRTPAGEQLGSRSYSLVGKPSTERYRIAVRLETHGRGGSAWMHQLGVGDQVSITRPSNDFPLTFGREQYLLIAGGIGITPIVYMASVLRELGASYLLAYAGRTRSAMPFLDELRAEHGPCLEVGISAEGTRFDLDALMARVDPDAEVYVCGPQPLRDSVRRAWTGQGRPPGRVRSETFASGGWYPAQPFTVHVIDTGHDVPVAETVSLLDALDKSGVPMMWECLRGECGLCVLDVIEVDGVIDHRDTFFSDEQRAAGKKICSCVSRVVGDSITVDTGYRRAISMTRRLTPNR